MVHTSYPFFPQVSEYRDLTEDKGKWDKTWQDQTIRDETGKDGTEWKKTRHYPLQSLTDTVFAIWSTLESSFTFTSGMRSVAASVRHNFTTTGTCSEEWLVRPITSLVTCVSYKIKQLCKNCINAEIFLYKWSCPNYDESLGFHNKFQILKIHNLLGPCTRLVRHQQRHSKNWWVFWI